jgi:ABC-type Fe3+-siderophore transport system permease subunit
MKLDIRLPIGLLFTLIGALLVMQGFFAAPVARPGAAGLNIDLAWGAVMLVFGALMLTLAVRHARRR